jgi:hypothetical protein
MRRRLKRLLAGFALACLFLALALGAGFAWLAMRPAAWYSQRLLDLTGLDLHFREYRNTGWHLRFKDARIDWRGRRLLSAPGVDFGFRPQWVGRPRLALSLRAEGAVPVYSNLDSWLKEPGTKWRSTNRPVLSSFVGWRLEVAGMDVQVAGHAVRLDAWVDDRLRGSLKAAGRGLALEADGNWETREARWRLTGNPGFGRIKGRGALKREESGLLRIQSEDGILDAYETFGVLPDPIKWNLAGTWNKSAAGKVRFDWGGGRATVRFSLDEKGGFESLILSDAVWENVVWGPRKVKRIDLNAEVVGKKSRLSAHLTDLETSLPFLREPARSREVDLAWDGQTLAGLFEELSLGKGRGRLRIIAQAPWNSWRLNLEMDELDLGLLGAPAVKGSGREPSIPWPAFHGECRVKNLIWKGESLQDLEGDWEWKAPVFSLDRFMGNWRKSPVVGNLSYRRDIDNGELGFASRKASLDDLWRWMWPGEKGSISGLLDLEAWAKFSSRGLAAWGGRFSNQSPWHLDRTAPQEKIWSSPLVSSLKSREDFILNAFGEAQWTRVGGLFLSNTVFQGEGFRFLARRAEMKDPQWSAQLSLAMDDDFLGRYLIPSAALRSRARAMAVGTFPSGWEKAYGIEILLEKRADGKIRYELH